MAKSFRNGARGLTLGAALMAGAALAGLAACAPHPADKGALTAPVGKLPDGATPTAYRLDLTIDPAKATFDGKSSIDVTLAKPSTGFWLHGLNLTVTSATLKAGGAAFPVKFEQKTRTGAAYVSFGKTVPAGAVTLDIAYSAPFADQELEGLYHGPGEDKIYVASQMEPIGARRMMPAFDEPRFKTPYTLTITAPKGDAAVTNSLETTAEDLPDGQVRHHFATTAPLQSYLIAVAVGPYDVVDFPGGLAANDVRAAAAPLRGVAAKGKGDQLAVALGDTNKVVSYEEHYFNVPYAYGKLDLIASPAFAYGAMENAGAIMYRETALLVPKNAAFSQRRRYLGTHTHELAHQWFGNFVTPAWWEDIWLNEAFASWFGNKTAAATFPELEFQRDTLNDALDAMALDSLSDTRQIMNPVAKDDDIDEIFDPITYQKGGGVLAMFERYMGEDKFREGVRLHMKRYGNGVATSAQFFQSMADGSGKPEAAEAFKTFVTQKHVPLLSAKVDCSDPKAPKAALSQTVYKPLASTISDTPQWKIPACLSYSTNGKAHETCVLVDQPSVTVALEGGACPVYLAPNAAGAGYYRFALDESGWAALLKAFDHLPATEQLVTIDSAAAAFEAGTLPASTFVSALRAGAKAKAWDVADRALGEMLGRSGRILEASGAEASLRAELKRTFGGRAAALYASKSAQGGDRLLRSALVAAMVVEADDPAFIQSLGAGAKAGDLGLMDKEPDLRRAIAAAGVKANNGVAPDALLSNALASKDQGLRADALAGIASAVSADGAKALMTAVGAGKIPGTDLQTLLGSLARNAAARPVLWDWLKANAARAAELTPKARKNGAPSLANDFCDAAAIGEVETYFTKTAVAADGTPLFPGFERSLKLASENVTLCSALKTAKAAELKAALGDAKG